MAKIINFPSKKSFIEPFRNKVSGDILEYMSEAHDRVIHLCNQFPSTEFRISPGYEKEVTKFKKDLNKYILFLLQRILELEAELCLAKRKT